MSERVEGIVFDIDGTVARGKRVLPGVMDTLGELRRRGIRYAFFTNDNSSPVDAWVVKLDGMGIAAGPGEIVTSAIVAAEVTAELYSGRKILAVGDVGLVEALRSRGLELIDDRDAEAADVVVMGKDPAFDQQRLQVVCTAIWAGAEFVATNYDPKVPAADGFIPATGPMVKAVSYATDTEPIVTGKPSRWSGVMAARTLGVAADRAAVVGDQLATDIAMGVNAGMTSILVLTGNATREDAAAAPAEMRPDVVLPDMTHLVAWLDQERGSTD